jgi:hypothetical protein
VEDLVFITAFCPYDEQIEELDRSVDSVNRLGFDVALLTHTHVPLYIQKKCKFYVYDHVNEISDDLDLRGFRTYSFNNKTIYSKYFSKYFYGFSIYRMFAMASSLAKNYGYEKIHHLEYDCQILDKELIVTHSNYLDEYDSVMYTDTGDGDGFMFGSFKSFRTDRLPKEFANYDKEFIRNKIKNSSQKPLEFFTKDLFKENCNILFQNISLLNNNNFLKGKSFFNRRNYNTLFYDEADESINFFYGINNQNKNLTIILNHNHVLHSEVFPKSWHILKLGKLNEISHVRVDDSETIIREMDLNSINKEIFKQNSFIVHEENN